MGQLWRSTERFMTESSWVNTAVLLSDSYTLGSGLEWFPVITFFSTGYNCKEVVI